MQGRRPLPPFCNRPGKKVPGPGSCFIARKPNARVRPRIFVGRNGIGFRAIRICCATGPSYAAQLQMTRGCGDDDDDDDDEIRCFILSLLR